MFGKKLASAVLLLVLIGVFASSRASSVEIALIAKVSGIPFFDAINAGAQEAAKELGVTVSYVNPVEPTAEGQIEVIDAQILRGVDCITISANDPDALVPVCKKAMEKGILVTSWDSGVAPAGNKLFIEPGDLEAVARLHLELLAAHMKYEGKWAIVSAGAQMTVQNTFIHWLKEEMKKDQYNKMELVATVYGDDVMEKSYNEAMGLLTAYPDLKGIISPTTIGVVGSAQAVSDQNKIGQVAVNGLGLPSQNVGFLKSGAASEIIIWNPVDVGYLTIYANHAILSKKISGKPGDVIDAGRLGKFTVKDLNGLPTVTTRSNVVFTVGNVDEWAKKL